MPSVVAGVVRDGALAWSAGRGRLPDGSTPDADVQYRIGSITKTFTAVLVIRLRDEGLLRLDDPLEQHVPGTPLGASHAARPAEPPGGAAGRDLRPVVGAHARRGLAGAGRDPDRGHASAAAR